MSEKYDHSKIEKKWQDHWSESGLYKTEDDVSGKENLYILTEFPYPSGDLHVGHWYAFSVPDILARFKRMNGYNVMFPFGFDAFGLPAENAAIKRGLNPREWTYANIEHMKEQLAMMGASFDWKREVVTCDPEYYKWTQWFFIQFFKNKLAYQKESPANWCPSCKTVLANEQVVNGHCERCDSPVEKKDFLQWNLKITDYAERLIDDLEELDWPEEIKLSQNNWIGRHEGTEIDFEVVDSNEKLRIFTTRPDTLFGASYLVLAPEHPFINKMDKGISNIDEVKNYIKEAVSKSEIERTSLDKDKSGVELKGVAVIHPGSGEKISVWVGDYVIGKYATGAIMGVPAHDDRDFNFATKYGLPIITVIKSSVYKKFIEVSLHDKNEKAYAREIRLLAYENNPIGPLTRIYKVKTEDMEKLFDILDKSNIAYNKDKIKEKSNITIFDHDGTAEMTYLTVHTGDGVLVNSGEFNGVDNIEAKELITKSVGGNLETKHRLRDWGVSRQRYWGVPIPIIHCDKCGPVPVPEEELPLVLPEIKDYLPQDDGKSPLSKADDWVHVPCPECGTEGERETDTLDTFVDSSWYFLRYTDPKNEKEFASGEKMKKWMPVDFYSGGAEHTTMHLLYSRFWQKALFDIGLVKDKEPYKKRMNRGLILGPDGNKMSKSKGNTINPDEVVERLGADTMRMYLAFIGPFNEVGTYPWNPDGIVGVRRFLERVWRVFTSMDSFSSIPFPEKEREIRLHQTIKMVTDSIENMKFNTGVAALMKFLGTDGLGGDSEKSKNAKRVFLKLLSPFAPHIAEELWHELGEKNSIHLEDWPKYDESKIVGDKVTIAVQVNGKARSIIEVNIDEEDGVVLEAAKADFRVSKWLEEGDIKKVIYVKNKIINIVI